MSKENYALAFTLLTKRLPAVQPRTDGRTDMAIMSDLLAANGESAEAFTWGHQSEALIEAAARNRENLLIRGSALAGAADCLRRLSGEPGVAQSVLTGNVEPNARVKLGAFGLDEWLDFSLGAYGSESRSRAMLVPVAQAKAAERLGFRSDVDVTVLIGDTHLDVEAGRQGGARVIGVATGISSVEELRASGADAVLPDLEDVDAFMDAVSAVQALGAIGPRATPASE